MRLEPEGREPVARPRARLASRRLRQVAARRGAGEPQAARGERVDAGSRRTSSCSGIPSARSAAMVAATRTHPTPAQRSLQMGLRGEATRLLAAAEDGIIAAITDVTSAFAAVGAHLEAGEVDAAAALLPTERLYSLPAGCAIADRAETATAAATHRAAIPTVDFAPFMRDEGVTVGAAPTDAQAAVAAQIDAVCRGDDFVHLVTLASRRSSRRRRSPAVRPRTAARRGPRRRSDRGGSRRRPLPHRRLPSGASPAPRRRPRVQK